MVFVTIIIAFLLCQRQPTLPEAKSNSSQNADLYASVPQTERTPFRSGLEKFIALRKSGSWNEMYELLDNDNHLSRPQFADRMRQLAILTNFQPDSITYIPPSHSWSVDGCAQFLTQSGSKFTAWSSIRARQMTQGWKFSDIAVQVPKDEPTGRRACSI
jgi:hypothetical protein